MSDPPIAPSAWERREPFVSMGLDDITGLLRRAFPEAKARRAIDDGDAAHEGI